MKYGRSSASDFASAFMNGISNFLAFDAQETNDKILFSINFGRWTEIETYSRSRAYCVIECHKYIR